MIELAAITSAEENRYGKRHYPSGDRSGPGALFDILAGEDVHRAYAGITRPNEASSAVHKKFGFQSVGIYHAVGRKFDKYWDVEWFEKRL